MTLTHIQWCDRTHNMIDGCIHESAGCDNCYIVTTLPFRTKGIKFDKPGVGGTTGIFLHPERLLEPMSWGEPSRVFANSMSDMFLPGIPRDLLARIVAVMSMTPRHTYVVLTKRSLRMRRILGSPAFAEDVFRARDALLKVDKVRRLRVPAVVDDTWPLPNLHLGVSVENQLAAERRVHHLLRTPAAVHFASVEPLIDQVDLRHIRIGRSGAVLDALAGRVIDLTTGAETAAPARLTWLVVGGESGRQDKARRMDPAWAQALLNDARDTGVAYFFKQYGTLAARNLGLRHSKGGDAGEWPRPWPREIPGPQHGASAR